MSLDPDLYKEVGHLRGLQEETLRRLDRIEKTVSDSLSARDRRMDGFDTRLDTAEKWQIKRQAVTSVSVAAVTFVVSHWKTLVGWINGGGT